VLRRWFAFLFAVVAHGLLVVLIWQLFLFMGGWQEPAPTAAGPHWWWIDLLLLAQFTVPHSLLLRPGVRRRLERLIPSPCYGCFYTTVTCSTLLLLVLAWQTCPLVCYRLDGGPAVAVRVAYVLSWVALVYSLSLTGIGFQTGWAQLWGWLRHGRPPRRGFEVRGAYRWVRHPVYLSFLGQVWLTPQMTVDRLLLSLLLTGYIFLGSYFKDRRLLHYLGDTYREYQAQVPGYPLGFGPLGRVPIRSRPEVIAHEV
jgi:protein-S-isoprenylcysteine O-methyltransferase Ste14